MKRRGNRIIVNLTMDPSLADKIKEEARRQNRTVSNYMETLARIQLGEDIVDPLMKKVS